jgi:hypothetical protein
MNGVLRVLIAITALVLSLPFVLMRDIALAMIDTIDQVEITLTTMLDEDA